MARKTAMGKEPGNVSIALPKNDKGKFQPGDPTMFDGNTGAVKQPKQELKRVSPGVYRNAGGQLVGSKGQQLPRQPEQQARSQTEGLAQQIMGGAQQQGMQPGMQSAMQGIINQGQMNQLPPMEMAPGMQQNLNDLAQQQFQQDMPSMQNGYLPAKPGQQIQDLMYRYPPGQAPNFGAVFNYGQRQREQQQQPNTVSGLLQRRFR